MACRINLVLVLLFAHLPYIQRTCAQNISSDSMPTENGTLLLIGNVTGAELPVPTTLAATKTTPAPATPLANVVPASTDAVDSGNTSTISSAAPAGPQTVETTTTPQPTQTLPIILATTTIVANDSTTAIPIASNNDTTIDLRNISKVGYNDSAADDSFDSVRTNEISKNDASIPNGVGEILLTGLNDKLSVLTNDTEKELRPGNCTGFPMLAKHLQPIHSAAARLRKCCPLGQNYEINNVTGSFQCTKENMPFDVHVIDAVFYQHCIEDSEQPITLDYKFGIDCDGAFLYNKKFGDLLYVLQNGSLLRVQDDFSGYEVSVDYCLDMNRDDEMLTALVCAKQDAMQISRAEAYLYATCLLLSVPCLFVTTFFYIHIDELRNLHGKSLACHSLCLAIAFLLISVAQIRGHVPQSVGYVIQYFMLACFLWVAVMCADICIHVWWHLPKYHDITQKVKTRRFICYSIISFGVPFILVLMAGAAQEPGQPSYYLKGVKEAARTPLNYFIPPISSILFICFGLLVGSYFGFRKIFELEAKVYIMQKSYEDGAEFYNQTDHIKIHIEDVKRTARSTAYLYLIMTINWIFEIISFYTQVPSSSSLVLFDVLNALQGVVIFIIFLCLPRPKRIITRWWKSEGTMECNNTEMEVLNNHSQHKK